MSALWSGIASSFATFWASLKFFWPSMLWLLLLIPVLVLIYWLVLRRRKRAVLRYANLGMVKAALGSGPSWRRHVPPLLFLLALSMIIVSVARPAAMVPVPQQRGVIMLALDVSGSMLAEDVEPNRLEAAKNAVHRFIAEQPAHISIGVAAFSGTAVMVQSPTLSRADVASAVNRLFTYPGTAMGSGLLVSLAAIFEGSVLDIEIEDRQVREFFRIRNMLVGTGPSQVAPRIRPADPGSYSHGLIVLLTDGDSNAGPDPMAVAELARDLGVRIFTIGLGSEEGEVVEFMGRSERVTLNVEPLQQIAAMTDAEFYHAVTAEELAQVYQAVSTRFVVETEDIEVTALFTAVGGALTFLSLLLSLLWFNRIGG